MELTPVLNEKNRWTFLVGTPPPKIIADSNGQIFPIGLPVTVIASNMPSNITTFDPETNMYTLEMGGSYKISPTELRINPDAVNVIQDKENNTVKFEVKSSSGGKITRRTKKSRKSKKGSLKKFTKKAHKKIHKKGKK